MRRLMLASLALAACSGAAPAPDAGRTSASGPANRTPTTPPFRQQELARFAEPFAFAFLPDGAVLVTEKAGVLKLRNADGSIVGVAGVPAVAKGGQGGLLDVAVAPDFATSRLVYLSYSEATPDGSQLALARARLDGTRLAGLRVLWRSGSAGKGGQYGANIAFAPDGRSLFLASGERQRFTPAQDPDQALGKIVHLTLDGGPAADNPQAGRTGAATVAVFDPPKNTAAAATARARTVPARSPNATPAETWSTGHRNPYGLAFDAGGRLWEVEMGPKGGDEVNLIRAGGNYGWPRASNGDNYDGSPIPDHRPGDGFVAPAAWWNPSISPGGMMIYSGATWPQWRGSMFVAALSGEALIRLELSTTGAKAVDQWSFGTRLRDVAQAPDGAIWVLEDDGPLVRLAP